MLKILRDAFGSDVSRLVIDSPTDYAQAHEIIARLSPDLQDRIELYDGDKPIFEQFKIEAGCRASASAQGPLPSGGSLIIDQTEALVSIDVNSGKFTGSSRPVRHHPQDQLGSDGRDRPAVAPARSGRHDRPGLH